MNTKPLISVVIPVKNGEQTISSCLNGIFKQTLKDKLEVIVIDSGSTDKTISIVKQFPVRLKHIAPHEFNHGDTRNLGVQLSNGDFVLMTVQDAIPMDEKWIEQLYSNFIDDDIVGVCGQQVVPHQDDKNPLQWFRPVSDPEKIYYEFNGSKKFADLSGKEQRQYCNWDDVTAMYRKSVFEKIPFRRIMFSEDTLWAKDILMAGYKIVYDYKARVCHYHHQNYRYYSTKNFLFLYQNYKNFNFFNFPENLITSCVRIVYRMAKQDISLREKFKWTYYNMVIIIAKWNMALIFFLVLKLKGVEGIERLIEKKFSLPPLGIQNKKYNYEK